MIAPSFTCRPPPPRVSSSTDLDPLACPDGVLQCMPQLVEIGVDVVLRLQQSLRCEGCRLDDASLDTGLRGDLADVGLFCLSSCRRLDPLAGFRCGSELVAITCLYCI